jgi:hypothetical protein
VAGLRCGRYSGRCFDHDCCGSFGGRSGWSGPDGWRRDRVGLQLAAFALLLAVREKPHLFMGGWLGGMILRFGGLGLVLYWASRTSVLPRTPLVIGLVGFVFVLLLLEPVFLRWDLRKP